MKIQSLCLLPLFAIVCDLEAEDLSAPPLVTAEAWAIADGETGEILHSKNADQPSKTASITKLMTAYTVMKLVAVAPEILEERVTFSKLADGTTGSTANVVEGESVTVLDCLYGLLLPSGNDAGNALAQHFRERLDPPDEEMRKRGLANPLLKSRIPFLAEMNRNARALGMKSTFYRSVFGDGGTPEDRTSTAADLCLLGKAAMEIPLLRKIVATQEKKGTVHRPDRSTRTQLWENTNSLLALETGYDGIKTGYTKLAGRCLLSTGSHEGRRLMVVVLGSDSVAARDADSRNLYRWAWSRMVSP